MMLSDRNRIFTNLYGQDDWRLVGALRRGVWDGTKGMIALGRITSYNVCYTKLLRIRPEAGSGLK